MTYQNQPRKSLTWQSFEPYKPTSPYSTKNLFESLVRDKTLVTITFLCGDTIQGKFVWFDLVGIMIEATDATKHYLPRKNIQLISLEQK